MPQITAVLDEKVIEKVDEEASKKSISRSKQIARCLEEYFEPSYDETEIERLKREIEHRDELIQAKEERIKDLQTQLGWLQTEHSKLADRLPALPSPQEKRKWIFWKK